MESGSSNLAKTNEKGEAFFTLNMPNEVNDNTKVDVTVKLHVFCFTITTLIGNTRLKFGSEFWTVFQKPYEIKKSNIRRRKAPALKCIF